MRSDGHKGEIFTSRPSVEITAGAVAEESEATAVEAAKEEETGSSS